MITRHDVQVAILALFLAFILMVVGGVVLNHIAGHIDIVALG